MCRFVLKWKPNILSWLLKNKILSSLYEYIDNSVVECWRENSHNGHNINYGEIVESTRDIITNLKHHSNYTVNATHMFNSIVANIPHKKGLFIE